MSMNNNTVYPSPLHVLIKATVANLQSDPVLHQKSNLYVHQVQIFLHLLIGANIGDHLLSETCHFLLLLKVQRALLQQVDKLTHH